MSNRIDGTFQTVSIRRVWSAATATGATALVLDTAEAGPIAFEISLEGIQILRQQLNSIEQVLTAGTGKA